MNAGAKSILSYMNNSINGSGDIPLNEITYSKVSRWPRLKEKSQESP